MSAHQLPRSSDERSDVDYRFPWANWFNYAVGILKLSPKEFWCLSVIEWRWLLQNSPSTRHETLSRHMLDALIEQYPDRHHG